MIHKISSVIPKNNLVLDVCFENGIVKIFDIKSLYNKYPQFRVLENDNQLYRQVKVDAGGHGISWNDELDFNANDIWLDGIEVQL